MRMLTRKGRIRIHLTSSPRPRAKAIAFNVLFSSAGRFLSGRTYLSYVMLQNIIICK